jgi:CTP:molybdopterin cytidylyltransferase MocA
VVAAVVLAAGASERFGGCKLLADLGGRPVLQHVVDMVESCPAVGEVVVVVGGIHAAAIRHGTVLRRGRFVTASSQTGPGATLRTGAAATTAERLVVVLGDQPWISRPAVERVLAAGSPARAAYDGRPGHPVVIPRDLAQRAPQGEDRGLRDVLVECEVALVEVGDVASDRDVDRPEDLRGPR